MSPWPVKAGLRAPHNQETTAEMPGWQPGLPRWAAGAGTPTGGTGPLKAGCKGEGEMQVWQFRWV